MGNDSRLDEQWNKAKSSVEDRGRIAMTSESISEVPGKVTYVTGIVASTQIN